LQLITRESLQEGTEVTAIMQIESQHPVHELNLSCVCIPR